jgi:hypothetical protein
MTPTNASEGQTRGDVERILRRWIENERCTRAPHLMVDFVERILEPASSEKQTRALQRIAEMPCGNLTGGECPDYWAIGLSKEACASCIARKALTRAASSEQAQSPDPRSGSKDR